MQATENRHSGPTERATTTPSSRRFRASSRPLAVFGRVASSLTAEAARRGGALRRHMVEGEIVEAATNQICGDWATGGATVLLYTLLPCTPFGDDQSKTILVDDWDEVPRSRLGGRPWRPEFISPRRARSRLLIRGGRSRSRPTRWWGRSHSRLTGWRGRSHSRLTGWRGRSRSKPTRWRGRSRSMPTRRRRPPSIRHEASTSRRNMRGGGSDQAIRNHRFAFAISARQQRGDLRSHPNPWRKH